MVQMFDMVTSTATSGLASTERSSTTVCCIMALEYRICRSPLRGDASRRAGGELQIDRAGTKRAEDAERKRRTISETLYGNTPVKVNLCRAFCDGGLGRQGFPCSSVEVVNALQRRGVTKCRVWLVDMSRVASRLRAMHDKKMLGHGTGNWERSCHYGLLNNNGCPCFARADQICREL